MFSEVVCNGFTEQRRNNAQLEICLDIYEAQAVLYLHSQHCASTDGR